MKFVLLRKATLLKIIATAIGVIALVAVVAVSGSASVFVGKTVRRLPIYCVGTEEKSVAISFDAAWGADKTEKILSTLETFDVKANFFVVGFWAEKYPEMLKKLADSGRIEIGTHSNTHPHMPKLTRSQMQLELTNSCNIIESVTGKRPELFRPPFGDYNDSLIDVCDEMKLYPIQWDVDSLDWKGLKAEEMATRVLSQVKSGSIVLMHNDGEHTVEALPLIIEGLKAKGYTIKTIGELIYREGYTVDHTGKQILSA
ncbi:MAG: polysaccharide deacetylase family protein [Clostridia bacterium]|nr:polysaccharide deacetylase family protein [Clostridia bacterium]